MVELTLSQQLGVAAHERALGSVEFFRETVDDGQRRADQARRGILHLLFEAADEAEDARRALIVEAVDVTLAVQRSSPAPAGGSSNERQSRRATWRADGRFMYFACVDLARHLNSHEGVLMSENSNYAACGNVRRTKVQRRAPHCLLTAEVLCSSLPRTTYANSADTSSAVRDLKKLASPCIRSATSRRLRSCSSSTFSSTESRTISLCMKTGRS